MLVHVPGVTSIKSPPPGKTFPFYNALRSTLTVNEADHKCRTPSCSDEHGPGEKFQTTDALVEAVDLYATLAELAGLDVPPTCPPEPFKIAFCTEGASLVPVIKNVTSGKLGGADVTGMTSSNFTWKPAVFSQYPRPADSIRNNSGGPRLADIRIMGYTMRTDRYRYTEWVAYDPSTFSANMSHVYDRELYDHSIDPEENLNVANQTVFKDLVDHLAEQLRGGWRKALPKTLH